MTHIHYKFSSKLSPNTVIFDGPHITLRELKKLIMGKEKLRAGDCDLQITNAQTKEEYKDDEGLIPKGSSVIVRRIPIIGARPGSNSKTRNTEQQGFQSQFHNFGVANAMDHRSSSRALPLFSKMTNLAAENVSEEDKIKAVLYQSSYSTMSYGTKSGASLPANYTCYRCGNAGHHIRNCPSSGQDKNAEPALRLKKSTGIPRSFMVEVDDPSIKGAMLTNCGSYAIPAIHANAYALGKKEKPPFACQEEPVVVQEEPIPNELLCLICHELLSDAVVIPCCGNSFCDDCIRNALLDSEQHSCPSCSQSDVSPDSLIANKFLRKAVNTFQKEQGQRNSGCGSSQSQNPALAPSCAPTIAPVSVQTLPPKPESAPAEGPALLPQPSGAPPTATSHVPPVSEPSASSHPAQSNPEGTEAENAAKDPAAPHGPASLPEGAPATLQASEAAAREQLQTISGAPQQQQLQQQQLPQSSSSDPAPGSSQPLSSVETPENFVPKDSSCSSLSSYPTAPQPLFNSPHVHPFLSAQQHLSSYPPGYPAAVPLWMLQNPPGSEWSPHRDSTFRRSPSHSKSKPSRSYSRSSSRSRSRSRSLSRSRRRSPYSRHTRGLHTRSHSSYSYGYKRSPTPSSSSSPQLGYRSRSRSPSDQRKKSHHHHHHHGRRSASSRHSSRRLGESPRRDAGGSENPYGQRGDRDGGFDVEQQRYLQWEREYKEWCDKYFSSYVSHFHQPPPAPFHLHPAALAPWQERGGGQQVGPEPRLPGGGAAQHRHHPSPRSHSSSDSCSTPSHSASDNRSSPSPVPSPRSRSSNDGPSTPTDPKGLKRSRSGKREKPLAALTEGSDNSEEQEERREEQQQQRRLARTDENTSASKHRRRRAKRDEREGGAGSSHPEAAGSADGYRKERRSHGSGGDSSPQQRAAKSSRDHETTHRRKRDSAKDVFADGGGHSDSRQDRQGQHKRRPSKERVRRDQDKCREPRGKSASDSRSERAQKRRGQESASSPRGSGQRQKTDKSDEPQTCKSESQDQSDKKKKERQVRPVAESHVWEGGMKVKAQKKISINISLDARQKEGNSGENNPEDPTGKMGEEHESPQDGMELGKEKNEKEEDVKQDEREPVGIWDVTSTGDDKEQTEEESSGEKAAEGEAKDSDSWLRAQGDAEEEPGTEIRHQENLLKAGGKEKWRSIEDGKTEVLTASNKEEERRESLHGGPNVSVGGVSSTEDHEEQKVATNSVEQGTQAGLSGGEDEPAVRQIPSLEWDLEGTEKGKQDIKVQTDAPAVSHLSQSSWVSVATTASREAEREKSQDRHRITERESKATTSGSRWGLAPPGGKDGDDIPPCNRRDPAKGASKGARQEREGSRWSKGERRTGREGRRSSPPSSRRADREMMRETLTSDSRVRDKQSPHRAGSPRHRSPSRSKERRRASRARDGSPREGRKHEWPDKVAGEAAAAEEDGQWAREEREGSRWETEEGERPGSSGSKSSSSSSTGGHRGHRPEKRRASPEPLEDWMPRIRKQRE